MTEITEGLKDKVVIDILRKNAERLRRENAAHLQVAINVQDTLTKSTAQYKAEIDKLKYLLIIRDGGGHCIDCNANYNRQCNCGHDSVEEYFNEVAK